MYCRDLKHVQEKLLWAIPTGVTAQQAVQSIQSEHIASATGSGKWAQAP